MKILRYALDYSLTAVVSEFCSYNLLVCQPEVLSFIRTWIQFLKWHLKISQCLVARRKVVLEKSGKGSRGERGKKEQCHRASGLLSRWPRVLLSDRCWIGSDSEVRSLIRELVEANTEPPPARLNSGVSRWDWAQGHGESHIMGSQIWTLAPRNESH